MPVPTRGLFEAHLTVADLPRSVEFYREIVGLSVALELPEREVAFLWVGGRGRSMLGLWSLGPAPLGLVLHVAFSVTLDDLLDAPRWLASQGVAPRSFLGAETAEPSVLAWMPAAAVYFRDPDGHQLEFLCMLDAEPKPDLGIVPWSEWPASQKSMEPV